MKRIYLILIALLFSLSCISQDVGRAFPKTIRFDQGIIVGDTGDFVQSIVFNNGKVEMNIDGTVYQLQPATSSPSIDSAVANHADTVYVYYDRSILIDQADTTTIDMVINSEYVGFESMIVGTDYLKFVMGDSIRPGNVVFFEYTKPPTGGLTDVFETQAEDAYYSVVNRAEEDVGAALLASWGFNGSLAEDSANYTLTKSIGAGYSSYYAEGTQSINVDGSNHYLHTNEEVDFTNEFAINFAYLSWYNADYPKCLLSNRDSDGGFEIYSNGADGNVEVRTFNSSGDSVVAKSNYAIARGKWNSIGINFSEIDEEVHFWINGIDEDQDTLAIANFAVDDTVYFGADATNEFIAVGYIDWPRFYDDPITETNYQNLHNAINIEPIIDTIAPSPDTANVGDLNDTTMVIQFNEELSNTTLDLTSFIYTEGGTAKTIGGYDINGAILELYIPAPAGGADLVCRYDSSGSADLQDAFGNLVDTFYLDVSNSLISGINLIAQYSMDEADEGADLSGNDYDGLENSASYSSTIKAEGTHSLYGSLGSTIVTPVLPLDSCFTLMFRAYCSAANSITDIISQRVNNQTRVDGGFEVGWDFVNGHIMFQVESLDGNSLQTINGTTGGPGQDEWIHFAMVFDAYADTVAFWVNGVFNYRDDVDFFVPMDTELTIGRGASGFGGWVDDIFFYDTIVPPDQILWAKENPGEVISGGGGGTCDCGGTYPDCDECPTDTDFDVIWTANFDHWETDKTLPVMYNADYGWTQDIEDHGGVAPEAMWEEDFFNQVLPRDGDKGHDNTLLGVTNAYTGGVYDRDYRDSIILDPLTGSPVLKVPFKKDRVLGYFGETAWVNLPGEDYDEIYFGYNVMFSPEWEPNKGGKILGYGGGNVTDFQPAKLPEVVSDEKGWIVGFAGRVMWDAGGFNTYSNYYNNPNYVQRRIDIQNGDAGWDDIVYPAKVEWDEVNPNGDTCDNGGAVNKAFLYTEGDNWIPRWAETDYRWYNVTYRLKMNSSTNADGFLEGYINGYLVHYINGIRWFENSASLQDGYNRFRIALFYGGGTLNEAAPKDCWFLIDDIWYGMPRTGHGNTGINAGTRNNNNTYLRLPNWPKH